MSETLGATLAAGVEALGGGEDARTDAEVLLLEATGRPRHQLWSHPEATVSPAQRAVFVEMAERRRRGEPVAHIVGRRGFWTVELECGPDALIPRPETELLVEAALALDLPRAGVRVLDLGTGTGAIAIALAMERPGWKVIAGDASDAALAIARRNVERLGIRNVALRAGDWFDVVRPGERFALVVSNPPYVAADDPHLEAGDLRFEPRSALASGPDGLDALRAIAASAPEHLEPGGWLLVEHGFEQGEPVRGLFREAGFEGVGTRRDLAGLDRVTGGHRAGPAG